LDFEWDPQKNAENIAKHGVSFEKAVWAFLDGERVIFHDVKHSTKEMRFFLLGKVDGRVLTVRFAQRRNTIRIIGAGFWRRGSELYEKAHSQG